MSPDGPPQHGDLEAVTRTEGPPRYIGPAEFPDQFLLHGEPLSGGEGRVWRATFEDGLQAPIMRALKIMRPTRGDGISTQDRRALHSLARLLQESTVPHLVKVWGSFEAAPEHEASTADPPAERVLVLEMEWVPGPTVEAAFAGRPATAESLDARLQVVQEVAEALAWLHSQTVMGDNAAVFRDVKPSNCILAPGRGAVLVDPGTIQLTSGAADLMGRHTPAYCAPEVLENPYPARRPSSDSWSLGAFAAYCLLGADPPRDPASFETAIRAVLHDARGGDQVADLILRLVRSEPEARIGVRAFALELERLRAAASRPDQRVIRGGAVGRRRVRVGLAVAGAALVAAAAAGATVLPPLLRGGTATAAAVAGSSVRAPARSAAPSPSASAPASSSAATPSASSAPPPSPATSSASASTPTAAVAPAPASSAPAIVPSQEGCLATATTHSFTLPDGGTVDNSVAYGPLALSPQCDFIAIKLTKATYTTWARACLDTAEGPGTGPCGSWVRLSYPNTWDTLLTGVSGGDVTWTLDIYGEASEDVRFSYTN